jgi:hypothetical protein
MPEPITLTLVGTVALTEGIKFLYSQATEILRRRNERREAEKGAGRPAATEPIDAELPDAFEGQLSDPQIHFDALERVEGPLKEVRKDLSDYAEGIEAVDDKDEGLLLKVDALRKLLEAVLQERITFKGEMRPPSGPVVEGRIDVDEVAGYAAAVRAGRITGGHVRAEGEAKRVEVTGEFVALEADTIGDDK